MPWHFESLAFESGVFGVPVGRLIPDGAAPDIGPLCGDWRARGVWLVSCRIAEDDAAAHAALGGAGFRPVERLLTLRRPLQPSVMAPAEVGPATANEQAATIAIAGRGFIYDRFHADPEVPNALADRLKARWVENGLKGRADAALVAREKGNVIGFVLCMRAGDDAVIDLIAVAPEHRGKGIGRRLVAGALAHYRSRAQGMRVGTQDTNAPSLRLYEGMGFAVQSRRLTFHWTNPAVHPGP